MADYQKGRKKTGGRVAGTPNKVTSLTKSVIADILANYKSSGLMDSDLMQLEPKDRLHIMEKFMQYIMPKIQSVEVDLSENMRKRTIEDKLIELSQEE